MLASAITKSRSGEQNLILSFSAEVSFIRSVNDLNSKDAIRDTAFFHSSGCQNVFCWKFTAEPAGSWTSYSIADKASLKSREAAVKKVVLALVLFFSLNAHAHTQAQLESCYREAYTKIARDWFGHSEMSAEEIQWRADFAMRRTGLAEYEGGGLIFVPVKLADFFGRDRQGRALTMAHPLFDGSFGFTQNVPDTNRALHRGMDRQLAELSACSGVL